MEEAREPHSKKVKTETEYNGKLTPEEFHSMYQESINDNEIFWKK